MHNNLVAPQQFAYVKSHSMQMALHSMTENWLNAINNKLITAACFIDLSKCFDSIPHSILISKLRNFGISGIEQSWFTSYLNLRSQVVKCDTRLSSKEMITIGFLRVPF